MTKSQQIMALYDGIRTTAEIAKIVGCRPEYVRVVARQRKGAGLSATDVRYRSSNLGKETIQKYKRNNINASRSYAAARIRVLKKTGNEEKSREKGRAAYRAARKAGKSVQEATNAYKAAQQRVLCKTGDIVHANRTARAAFAAAKKSVEAAE